MAITQVAAVDEDLFPLQEIVELLGKTGHPVSLSTLKRWIIRYRLSVKRIGRADRVSYSRILEIHRDEINARLSERA